MAERKTALIIDPFAIFRCTLKGLIQKSNASVNVFEAEDAGMAMDVLKDQYPDVVFLEIALHHTKGIELIGSIKEMAPKSQIVVLTNHDSVEHKEACFEKGADYFFSKEQSNGINLLNIINSTLN